MTHLVIGANSKIGAELFRQLEGRGENVIGTTRRNDDSGMPKLDLLSIDPSDIPACDVAYICAAAIKPVPGEMDAMINGTLDVINRLCANGAFPVFLSSQAVEVRTDDYAKTKAAIERGVSNLNVCVMRLGDVMDIEGCASEIIKAGISRRPGLKIYGKLND